MAAVERAHMTMQCPRCSTRWRVAAASPVENPLFKCGRCHKLFRQFPGAPPSNEASSSPHRSAAAPIESDTLEFIFPERLPADAEDAPGSSASAASTAVVMTALPDVTERSDDAAVLTQPQSTVVSVPDDATDQTLDEPTDDDDDHGLGRELFAESVDEDPTLVDLDEADPPAMSAAKSVHLTFRVEDPMKAPTGFGTIVRALGLAVTAFAVLALIVRLAPERTSAWLSRLPLVGAGFAHDRNLVGKIELRNVQGQFQRLRNARRVFVISGDARNNSSITIERIEIAGGLYGLGGGELDQKVVSTGNRTTLTNLSEAEIVLLQRLDPAIALAPGATTPFLIVFLEPPRELREFSSRVLTVRPTRRASVPPRPVDPSRNSVG